MSERELNKKWLKEQLKEFAYSNDFLEKILDLLSEEYRNGLQQGWFDREMDMLNIMGELKFLRQREKKLQMIEHLYANEPVDLTKLAKLVKGDE